jgi:hypothetical protein
MATAVRYVPRVLQSCAKLRGFVQFGRGSHTFITFIFRRLDADIGFTNGFFQRDMAFSPPCNALNSDLLGKRRRY